MKALFDFIPLLIFFVTYKLAGIFPATAALVIASLSQFTYLHFSGGKVSPIQKFSLVLVVLLGGGALLFHDQRFLLWKPTLANLVFAGAVLFTLRKGAKPAAQIIYEEALGEDAQRVTPNLWRRFSFQWIAFFIFEGLLNLVIAFNCSLDAWVNFKFFGLPILSLVMGCLQMLQLRPFLSDTPTPAPLEETQAATG